MERNEELFEEIEGWGREVDGLKGQVRELREERDQAVRGVREGEERRGEKVREFDAFVGESARQKEFADRKIEKLTVDVEKKTKKVSELAGNLAQLEK